MGRISDEQVLSIRGAFWQPDLAIFRVLLGSTEAIDGDVMEMGALFGRSAALIGSYLRDNEEFTVVDLFGSPAKDAANGRENSESYATLSRESFEQNYVLHHAKLPRIIQDLSSEILTYVQPGTHRFVHIDASHLYAHVICDIRNAQKLLNPEGILVLDDFRAEHTPGVAAAAWQACFEMGLRPFAISPHKMYATWNDDNRWRSVLEDWVVSSPYPYEIQQVLGRPLLRILSQPETAYRVKKYVPPAAWSVMARSLTWRNMWTKRQLHHQSRRS